MKFKITNIGTEFSKKYFYLLETKNAQLDLNVSKYWPLTLTITKHTEKTGHMKIKKNI